MDLRDAGILLHNWNAGMGDPIYMVGSLFFIEEDYPDLNIVRAAKGNLERCLEKQHSEEDVKELKELIAFLEKYIEDCDCCCGDCYNSHGYCVDRGNCECHTKNGRRVT